MPGTSQTEAAPRHSGLKLWLQLWLQLWLNDRGLLSPHSDGYGQVVQPARQLEHHQRKGKRYVLLKLDKPQNGAIEEVKVATPQTEASGDRSEGDRTFPPERCSRKLPQVLSCGN
ncbi:Hypothetical predicted protein [Drosophila guanche]|uniref:Uncharacterized protein n=1 Tax=Drosophila guanche TaxID=7266 RepID=A0A3B0JHJ0_DROGU|nr:Hypothetical predicted protein [Drosophila guanche]